MDPYGGGASAGIAEIQVSSGEESVGYPEDEEKGPQYERMTDLGNKRNQRYIRHVKDPEEDKAPPPWRNHKGRRTRSQAEIVWGGPTTGNRDDEKFLEEKDRIERDHDADDAECKRVVMDAQEVEQLQRGLQNLRRPPFSYINPHDGRAHGWFEKHMDFEARRRGRCDPERRFETNTGRHADRYN